MDPAKVVSIHPYFRVNEGKLDEFKSMLPRFIEKTSTEEDCLYYDFTICDQTVFCREGYRDGDAALAHLDNVGPLLEEALGISELVRLEIHGSAEELDKLREPLDELNPSWFIVDCCLTR